MQITLTDGSTICVEFNKKGELKSAAKAIQSENLTGYITIDFLTPTIARETYACPAQGFSSVKLFENNQVIRENCTDLWHKKALYYTYENGKVAETLMQSLGTPCSEQKERRSIITHAPDSLHAVLSQESFMVLPGQHIWKPGQSPYKNTPENLQASVAPKRTKHPLNPKRSFYKKTGLSRAA